MPNRVSNKDRLQEITASIEDGIKDLFQSEKYMQYLRTMSRFHKYSVNNVMLIHMQRPDATLVAGFNKWKDQFSRNVMKGEKGIKIIAPTPFKKKIEQEKLDPDTRLPMLDADGKVITEEKTVQIPMYKVVSVFDVSQTDGKPLPALASDLTGNVQNYEVFMEALKRSAPVPITLEPMAANMDGFFSSDDQRIAIREGMSEVQTVSATVHEIAHSKLHNYEKEKEQVAGDETVVPINPKNRSMEEVEAESISYAVCAYYGIETGENSFGYLASWSKGKELSELRESLETINKTSSGLITDIDRNYAAIMKERGLDKVAPEQTAEASDIDADSVDPAEGLFLLDDSTYLHLQPTDGGYDYSLYDKDSMKLLDGGVYEDSDLPDRPARALTVARVEILALQGLTPEKVEKVSLDMLVQLQAANEIKEPYFEYKLHANPRSQNDKDAGFIQAYEHKDGQQYPADIIGIGAYSDFIPLVNRLNEEKVTPEDAIKITDEYAYTPPVPEVECGVEEAAPTTAPENGYLPDPAMSIEAMNAYGYTDADMLPLSRERAIELFQRDVAVYMLYDDNTEAIAFDTDEIIAFDGMLGVTAADWELAPADLKVQKPDMEQAFINNPADCFAIYQVKSGEEYRDLRFERYDQLEKQGIVPDRANYDCVYTAPLTAPGGTIDRLDALFDEFNDSHPTDFRGHSASVSDIIALKQAGEVSYHYIDAWGYKELPAFQKPENYLKNAEMATEDDYGMIDGVINNGVKQPTVAELEQQAKSGTPISLMDLAAAVHCERDGERKEKRPSVLAQLKSHQEKEKLNIAPKKSAEREL